MIRKSPCSNSATILKTLIRKAALALPGVVLVVTMEDLGDVGRIPTRLGHRVGNVACLQRPLARDKVRYVGEPVAFVVAESRYLAEDALDVMEVDYDPLPIVADVWRSMESGAPLVHEVVAGNVADTMETRKGDASAAMAAAHVRVREHFAVQRHTGVPMETRGLSAATHGHAWGRRRAHVHPRHAWHGRVVAWGTLCHETDGRNSGQRNRAHKRGCCDPCTAWVCDHQASSLEGTNGAPFSPRRQSL